MVRNRLLGAGALVGVAALAAGAAAAFPAWRAALWTGFGAALALALPSFWSLAWAMTRSDKVFFSVFAGGALFRLAGLAVLAGIVHRRTTLSLAAVLAAAVGALTALAMIEVFFIQREGRPRA